MKTFEFWPQVPDDGFVRGSNGQTYVDVATVLPSKTFVLMYASERSNPDVYKSMSEPTPGTEWISKAQQVEAEKAKELWIFVYPPTNDQSLDDSRSYMAHDVNELLHFVREQDRGQQKDYHKEG